MSEGLRLAGFDVTGVDINPQKHYRGGVFVQADALTYPLEGFDYIHASPPCQSHSSLRHLQAGKVYPCHIDEIRERLQASGALWSIENVPGAPLGSGGQLILLCGTMFGLETPDGRAEIRRHRLFELGGFDIALRPACQHGHESLSVSGSGLDSNRERWAKRRACSCPTECDCEDFDAGLVSNECPEHNLTPLPSLTCPVHGEEEFRLQRRQVPSVIGAKGLPGLSHRRRALSVTGHAAEISPTNWPKRVLTIDRGGINSANTPPKGMTRPQARETFSAADARAAMQIPWMPMKSLSQAIPPAYGKFIGEHAIEALRAAAGRR